MDVKQEDVSLGLPEAVSIVLVSSPTLEAMTLGNVLAGFNYRVEVQRVGSRPQFLALLRGHIPTARHVVLCCQGNENGLIIPGQPPVSAPEVAQAVHLPGRILVSLGSMTGTDTLAHAFLRGGCAAYVAPTDRVHPHVALLFAIHLFYFLAGKRSLEEAVEEARHLTSVCSRFHLWCANHKEHIGPNAGAPR